MSIQLRIHLFLVSSLVGIGLGMIIGLIKFAFFTSEKNIVILKLPFFKKG